MFRLAQPEWLLLLPLLGGVAWFWPQLFWRKRLRLVLLLLLVLALVRPEVRLLKEGLDLRVVVDRSESAAEAMIRQLPEWEAILERHRPSHDRLSFIDYASDAVLRDTAAGVTLPGSREETRSANALRYALLMADPDRATRVLLLTDGYSTEPLDGVADLLQRAKVALDYRLTATGAALDFEVESVSLPPKAAPGEAFMLEFKVNGRGGSSVPYEILRNQQVLTRGTVSIPAGQTASLTRFSDRATAPGGYRYEVRILPESDAQPGNNQAGAWIEIAGGPRILVVTSYSGGSDPLVLSLRSQQFEVEVVEDPSTLHLGQLQGARAVVLNNVPAYHLPPQFLAGLDFFVREQGGGLLMAGGPQSFAKGGYSGSPIDELLPVSMQLKRDHRKLTVAMAIAMDRSGSMTATVPSGGTKMDLANSGAARSVELLNPNDQIAVFAVDTAPHTIVPLSVVGRDGAMLAGTIRGIRSSGGGIYIGEALRAALGELEKSPSPTKHLILFADANDSEKPDDYRDLIQKFTAGGGTISVIGLGQEGDSDAALLREISELGNGRIFFSASGADLPAIFEQETVAIARSAFIEEPTAAQASGTWAEIAARALEWPKAVDGYNLSYLRPDATAALLTASEEPAPLVAFWQRGSGRVAAVSFPLGGAFSESVRAWSGYGDFVQTLARWLQGETLPPGIGLRTRLDGTRLTAELYFDPTWEPIFAQTPPRVVLAGESEPLVWERMEPGLYRISRVLPPGELVRGALQVGKHVLPFGPVQPGRGAEWERRPERLTELAELARESGGQERVNLATIWDTPRQPRFREITPWLLGLLLVGLVVETLQSRLGRFRRSPTADRSPEIKPRAPRPKKAEPKPAPTEPKAAEATTPPASDTAATDRRRRFDRARRRQ